MAKLLTQILALWALVALTACGAPNRRAPNSATAQTYFVLGDPRVMLEGTAPIAQSFLGADQLPSFDNYTLAGYTVFVPKVATSEIDTINSQKDLEEQNKTEGSQIDSDLSLYRFTIDGTLATYSPTGTTFADYPTLHWTRVDQRWEMTALNDASVVAEHYSVSADKRIFSILVSRQDEVGNSLVALTFTRVDGPQKALPNLNNSYQYLAGQGIGIAWASPLTIAICGQLSATIQATFAKAVTDWSLTAGSAEGELGGLKYSIEYVAQPKPFNDVNQHCISLVKGYRLEEQENTAVLGVTIPTVDFQNFKLVGSHVFIFADALQKFGEPALPTTTHEVGHLLGLGHEFSRSASGAILHPSIMGYSGVDSITSWDVGAVLALYPNSP